MPASEREPATDGFKHQELGHGAGGSEYGCSDVRRSKGGYFGGDGVPSPLNE